MMNSNAHRASPASPRGGWVRVTVLAVAFLPGLLLTGGCQVAENPTPLGCDLRAGRFFDPATNACITPSSELQAHQLKWYRRISQVIEQGAPQGELRVYFNRKLSRAEFVPLMEQLDSAQISDIGLFFPRIDNGTNLGGTVTGAVSATKAVDMAFVNARALYDQADSAEEAAAYLDAFQKGEFLITTVGLVADTQKARAWWDLHRNVVCVVRPNLDYLDKSQTNGCTSN